MSVQLYKMKIDKPWSLELETDAHQEKEWLIHPVIPDAVTQAL